MVILSPKATADQQGRIEEEETVDSKILPYCSINKQEKKSLGELEQEFLQALQSFYYEGKAIMSNEEFDNLKEELMWEGSSVVMLSSDEQKFLEASMAYVSLMRGRRFQRRPSNCLNQIYTVFTLSQLHCQFHYKLSSSFQTSLYF